MPTDYSLQSWIRRRRETKDRRIVYLQYQVQYLVLLTAYLLDGLSVASRSVFQCSTKLDKIPL